MLPIYFNIVKMYQFPLFSSKKKTQKLYYTLVR